jgi:hypothetical protein
MAMDPKVGALPATQEQVASVAINAAVGLNAIAQALAAIANGTDITTSINLIREHSDVLEEIFDDLSGWHEDE